MTIATYRGGHWYDRNDQLVTHLSWEGAVVALPKRAPEGAVVTMDDLWKQAEKPEQMN